jgi:hypothetical protein
MTRAAWAAGACCLLFAVGTGGGRPGTSAFASSSASLWAAPVDEVPACVSDSSSLDAQLSDARFVAQGWRWSPGSTAWIAVLVRVDVLKAVGLARIGGLYGPDVLIRPFGFLPIRTVAIV